MDIENGNSTNKITVHDEIKSPYSESTLNNLKDGLLETYQPHMVRLQAQLEELTTKQNILVEQLHNENLKLAWSQNSPEYQEMFKKIQVYRNKLVTLKTDMRALHDKSSRLKKRATRLHHLKEKDEYTKLEQRRKELELIGNK